MPRAALRSIAWEGRFLVIGFAAGDIPKMPLNLAPSQRVRYSRCVLGARGARLNPEKESRQSGEAGEMDRRRARFPRMSTAPFRWRKPPTPLKGGSQAVKAMGKVILHP